MLTLVAYLQDRSMTPSTSPDVWKQVSIVDVRDVVACVVTL